MPASKTSAHRPLPQPIAVALANVLRTRREQGGLTQEDLAERSGVSVQMVRRLESGRANPTLGTLCAVTEALQTTMASALADARA